MTRENAQIIADLSNAAQFEILAKIPEDMRDWYETLPHSVRVEIAMQAACETVNALSAA